MKKALLALFAIICGSASAQVGWTFPNELKVAPGGTTTFTVTLDDDECTTYQSGSFYLSLPEGFSVVAESEKVSADRKADQEFSATYNESTKLYNCVLQTLTGSYIKGTSGPLVSMDLKCDGSVVEGEYTATITRSSITYYDEEEDEPAKVVKTNITITIKVEEASTETEKITLTKKYNTYVPAKALDFSSVEGLTAYYVTAVTATEATLTKATTVAAGEGIILEGTAGDYEVPVATAEVEKNSANLLATGTIAEGDYILYDGQFVLCTGGTLPDGKAYLPKSAISTSSAKALILGFGDATGINEAKAAKADGAIYSISGVRVAQPQKGVYIMNGRKVIVK